MFDPKKSKGIVSLYYKEALSDSLVVASQLQANLSSRGLESEVVFWGNLSDIKDVGNNLSSEKSLTPEVKSINTDSIKESDEKDFNGKAIKGLVSRKVPIKYNNNGCDSETHLTVYENKDLYELNKHAVENELITEEQKTKIDALITLIDPESKKYIGEVGIVNDVKKATVLFLEQKVFQGGSYYLDIDRAERLKEFDSSKYIRQLDGNKNLPAMYNMNGQEIDVMIMQNGRTDENKLYSVIDRYHDSLVLKKKDKNPKYAFQTDSPCHETLTDKLCREHYVINPELNMRSMNIAAHDPMQSSENDFFKPETTRHKGRTWVHGISESKERS